MSDATGIAEIAESEQGFLIAKLALLVVVLGGELEVRGTKNGFGQ